MCNDVNSHTEDNFLCVLCTQSCQPLKLMQLGAKLLASFVLTVGTLLTLESTMPTTAPLLVGACPGMYNQYVQSDSLPRGRAMCALLGTVGTPTEVFVRQYEFNVLSCVAPVSVSVESCTCSPSRLTQGPNRH